MDLKQIISTPGKSIRAMSLIGLGVLVSSCVPDSPNLESSNHSKTDKYNTSVYHYNEKSGEPINRRVYILSSISPDTSPNFIKSEDKLGNGSVEYVQVINDFSNPDKGCEKYVSGTVFPNTSECREEIKTALEELAKARQVLQIK